MTSLDQADLLALERRGWNSLCDGRGGAVYGDLMTAEARMVLVDGSVLDRDAVVASLDGAPTWSHYEIAEPHVIPLGPDSAALVYRATARRDDAPPFTALMTSVYRLVDGMPQLALYTQTAV
jgi:hypothetical protein